MAQAPRALNGADVVTALTNSSTVLPASVIPFGAGGVGPAGATAPATTSTLGGIKVGPGLLVAGDGTLSVDSVAPVALSGTPQPADGILLVRNGVTYLAPFSAFGPAGAAPATVTAFTTALLASSGAVGSGILLTATPKSGTWPSGVTLTPAATGLTGAFAPTTANPAGSTPASFVFTPSAAGSGTLSVSASPAMTAPAGLAYQAVAGAAPNFTFMLFQDNTTSSAGYDILFNLANASGTRITPSNLPSAGWTVSVGWSTSSTVRPAAGSLNYATAAWNGSGAGAWQSSAGGYPFGSAPGTHYPWAITSDGTVFCFVNNPHTFQ